MNITSTICVTFENGVAGRIYTLGRIVTKIPASERADFSLTTSSQSRNPDILVFKRTEEFTPEMVQALLEECTDIIQQYGYAPMKVSSISVKRTITEVQQYIF